ncbi:MAG TPA: PAS domain-containing protein [Spirochaetia bacterium]|nr:PAS domain-containing protein [Spirochaetia bacterium]
MLTEPQSPTPADPLTSTVEELRRENAALRKEVAALRERLRELGEALAESTTHAGRYKALYDALPVSVYVFDKDGIIVGVNPFHLKTMGRGKTSVDDYVGKAAAARPSLVAAGMSDSVRVILGGERFEALDVHFPELSGGGEAWCDVRGVPLISNGELVGGIVMSMDVTAYHLAKEELKRHVRRLEQTLGGFIPICASCKKVREQSGSWTQIEKYVAARTEAEFSHTLCPDCARQLFPEIHEGT